MIGHEAAAQDRGSGSLALRGREQEAFAGWARVGLQVLDPCVGADVEAGRLRRTHLLQPAVRARRDPRIEAIREGVEGRAEGNVEFTDGARRQVVEAQLDSAEIARLRKNVFDVVVEERVGRLPRHALRRLRHLGAERVGDVLAKRRAPSDRRNRDVRQFLRRLHREHGFVLCHGFDIGHCWCRT